MCSGEFARGQADGDGFLWRIGAVADDDEDGSSDGGAAAACGFIGQFISGRPHGLGVGCERPVSLTFVAAMFIRLVQIQRGRENR